MSKNLLTVVIVTKDRTDYLKESVKSVLAQSFQGFDFVVLDCGTDESIKELVDSLNDNSRIQYRKTRTQNIIDGWNQAVALADTKYLSIFHDDDMMRPNFLEKSIKLLEANPSAGVSYTQANKVDEKGKFISVWSENTLNDGLIRGLDYLLATIKFGCCITIAPTVIAKTEVYKEIGGYSEDLCFNTFDLGYWLRVADKYDFIFNSEVLVDYRIHTGQMSQTYWWEKKAKGRLGTMLELKRGIFLLLNNHREELAPVQLQELYSKYDEFNKLTAQYAKELIPGL